MQAFTGSEFPVQGYLKPLNPYIIINNQLLIINC